MLKGGQTRNSLAITEWTLPRPEDDPALPPEELVHLVFGLHWVRCRSDQSAMFSVTTHPHTHLRLSILLYKADHDFSKVVLLFRPAASTTNVFCAVSVLS